VIGVFHTVKPFVGDANQLISLFGVLGKIGSAVIHTDADGELKRLEHFRENGFDAASEGQRLRGIGLRENESKLVAADAKGVVRGAQRLFQGGCRGAQNFIAARMPMLVIHFLEAVQIQHDET
jgi:hypothetical protein